MNNITNSILKKNKFNYKEEETIQELKNKINKLQSDNQILTNVKQTLEQQIKFQNQKSVEYDRITNRFKLCKDRLLFITSFLQTLGKNSCAYGSTIRKMFECLLQYSNFEANNQLGDMLNSDINILFYYLPNHTDKLTLSTQFFNLLHKLDSIRTLSEKYESGVHTPTFYGYKLVSLNTSLNHTENNEIIPRAKLYFVKKTDSVCIDIICWRYKEIVDFSVNNFIINSNGIQPLFEYNFLQYLENIFFKETRFIHRPDILQSYAFPINTCLSRKDKTIFLSKMYNLISTRYIKIKSSDYSIVKNTATFTETSEECSITGCKAPYPYVILQCNHKISLMAYKGILQQTSDEDTQSIRCPMCRADLKVKFECVFEKTLEYKMINIDEYINSSNTTTLQDNKYVSREALEQL